MTSAAMIPKLPLKYVASINDEALNEKTDPDMEIKYIDIGNVESTGRILDVVNYIFGEAPSRARRIVRHGDVIISTVRTYLQAIGAIQHPPDNLIVSTGFAVVRSRQGKLDPSYCKYALREIGFISEVISRSVGVSYPAITSMDLGNIPIYVPSLSQQASIANFLDFEIARIDALIDAKQRLIEILEEKKRALITHNITNGINELPTMESGIDWADRIPVNWKVEPLFSTLHERKQINQGNVVDNVLSLSYGNIIKRDIESNFGLLPESFESYQIVCPGDIILRLTDLQNDKRSLRVGLVKEKGIITSAYVCLRCTNKIIPEYAYYLLHTYDLLKVFYNFGGGVRQTMRFEDLRRLPLIIPDMETQQEIVSSLGNQLPKFDLLIVKLTTSFTLLYEKRNSLISAAVTGQIDIPEASCN